MLNNAKRNKTFRCFAPDLVSMVDLVRNCCNNWYMDFGDNREDHVRYIFLTKYVVAVMFLCLVCCKGEVLPPVLFDSGYRLNTDRYIDVMTLTIIPWMRKVAGKKKFVFPSGQGPCPHSQQNTGLPQKQN